MAHRKNFESVLINNIKIIAPDNVYNGTVKNILIEKGEIKKISDSKINKEAKKVIDGAGKYISIGWFDLGTSLNEPGFEHKEDLKSLSKAALFGGFTEMATLPNSNPVIQTKQSIKYLKSLNEEYTITIHPIAAITNDAEGKSISEMIDLNDAGAAAFSDGKENNIPSDVIKKALLYVQAINGLLIYFPDNRKLYLNGQMHEGKASTMLGMKGMPSVAEFSDIERILSILRYTGGRIHFANISTEKSVDLIREAKREGLNVTCDISAHQIAFIDEDLMSFDTNLKVKPPFRSSIDITALWKGISDNTIDAIVSSHTPQDSEAKLLEYDLAEFGILGLETFFPVLSSNKPENISFELLIEKIAYNPRNIVNSNLPKINEGEIANLTIFEIDKEWEFTSKHIQSKSKNSPFIGSKFKGNVESVVIGDQVVSSEY